MKKNTPTLDDHVIVGGLQIPIAHLRERAAEAYARTGVVIVQDRLRVQILHGDIPVSYTVSMYVQRDPVTDAEAREVAAAAAARAAAKTQREHEDQARRDREIKRASELTRAALLDGLGAISELAPVLEMAKNIRR